MSAEKNYYLGAETQFPQLKPKTVFVQTDQP